MPLLRSHGPALRLRAHNLLCLQGFRGRGYDAAFVAEMTAVHRQLAADPDTPVEVVARPDRLCSACPHLAAGGCTLGGPEHEAHMHAQDEQVLRRLWLQDGEVLPWSQVLERIARSVRGSDLPGLCTTCPWLSLGWCAEGVDALREAPAGPLASPQGGPCGSPPPAGDA